MARGNAAFVSFNGGEIGKEIVSRTQIENYASTAALIENIMPEAAGPMSLRPGLKMCVEIGRETYLERFVFGIAQKYLMAFSDNALRIIQNGGVITRPAVTSTVTNGSFTSAIGTGWTDVSDLAGSATTSGGQLVLVGDGTRRAAARQLVTTSSAGTVHCLEIDVEAGPVTFKVGSGVGLSDYIATTELRKGFHSLTFTPSGSFYIEIYAMQPRQALVNSCQIAAAGDLVLTTPWTAAQFKSLRFQQSRDVIFVSGAGYAKRRIERRSSSSWSLVYTDEQDGPFLAPNIDDSLTLTPSVKLGNGTLTANRNFFNASHVGALFKLTQQGQYQKRIILANSGDQFTDPIKVTGKGVERDFSYTVTGTFTGTIRLQRSYLDDVSFTAANTDLTGETRTTAGTTNVDEDTTASGVNANLTFFYRLGASRGDVTVGSATVEINAPNIGFQEGICRVTSYTSETVVNIEILKPFSSTTATAEWEEGEWSDYQGHPRAVALFDDRLWNGYLDGYWASKTSLYETMKDGSLADDAIERNISTGDVGQIQWILPLSRVVFGTDSAEDVIRSSAFDDPITPTNLTVRDISSWGAADLAPTKVDSRGLFVDRSQIHIMELAYNVDVQDYVARPLTRFHKNIGRPGVTQLNVTRRPETRIFATRSDGQLLTKLYDPGENVLGWSRFTTPLGDFMSTESLPGAGGSGQDEDYFIIKRFIGGTYRYYLEQLGNIYSATAADANCLDSYVRSDQSVVNAIVFNGSSRLTRGADFTGNADGKVGTFSCWVKMGGSDSADQIIYASSSGFLVVRRSSTGTFQVEGKNAAGTTILLLTSTDTYDSDSGWVHLAASWDLAAGVGRMYIDNSNALASGSTLTNDNIDYTRTNHVIGASVTGLQPFTGELAEIYLSLATYLDISSSTNREKLISSSRAPVELGTTANGPTGLQPILCLRNAAATFGTNAGSGGNFTVSTGYITDSDDPPTAYHAAQSKIVTGLTHLEGEEVYAWVDGVELGPYTVASGQITLPVQPGQVCVGLKYYGYYTSSRLAFIDALGTGQAQLQQPTHITFVLARSSRKIAYGSDFDGDLDDLSLRDLQIQTDDESGLETGISEWLPIPSVMNRDPRICLRLEGPYPVTLAGYVLGSNVAPQT